MRTFVLYFHPFLLVVAFLFFKKKESHLLLPCFIFCSLCLIPRRPLCASADIWSLGVILFMLVCGQPPFQEANDSETLTMIMDCKYTVPPHISHACREWVISKHTNPHRWTEYSAGAAYFMFIDVWRKESKERGCGLPSAAPRCPAFSQCCSQLLHQRCSAALSVSNAPFKIGPLFLTLWGFNDTSKQSRHKCLLNTFWTTAALRTLIVFGLDLIRLRWLSHNTSNIGTQLGSHAVYLNPCTSRFPLWPWGNSTSPCLCTNLACGHLQTLLSFSGWKAVFLELKSCEEKCFALYLTLSSQQNLYKQPNWGLKQ